MAWKGKDKVVIEDEDNGEDNVKRSVQSVIENFVVGGESKSTMSPKDGKTVDETDIVKGNVEGLIEVMGWGDDFDDIYFQDADENAVREEMDRVNKDGCDNIIEKGKQNVVTIDEGVEGDDEESNQSDKDSNRSDVSDDDDDDGLGQEIADVPMLELTVLQEAEAAAMRPHFFVGMTFEDKKELKRAIDKFAITCGVNLKTVRSDKKTLKVLCEDGCPFSLYASTYGLSIGWQVKSLAYEHMCARVYKNPRASTMWLAEHFKEKVQEAPQFKTKEMKNEVQRDLKLCVSVHKCKRAKKKIMEEMEGSFKDEFGKLEAYCNELRVSNPGSDVCVEVSTEALEQGRRIFKRMYLCFNASKVGWKEGCRPLIGVDGTFLKGKARGILLTAVGIDSNDSLYPLALALVEKENALHWSWFLHWLCKSLDLGNGETVTIMSDMQKGLANAVGEVLPRAEHRFCARDIYANWSKKWRGNEFKKKFFTCAWSSFAQEFKDNLTSLGTLKKEAAQDAVTYSVTTWVRAYFSTRCQSWLVDNNISESFNAWIDEYRFLPVIRMFDGIRLKMMAKWAESESNVLGWKSDFSPKCMDLFESNKFLAVECRVFFNGDEGYEVVEGQDRHLVYLSRRMCTCRAWDLTGIPCQHAICAMLHAKVDPKSQISHYYHKDTYLAAYRTKLQPVRGKKFWDKENFLPMQPPPVAKLPGRPQKKRTRTDEASRRRKFSKSGLDASGPSGTARADIPQEGGLERLTRRGKSHKCTRCKQPGHNKSTCTEPPTANIEQKGRKRRHHSSKQQEAPSNFQTSQQPPEPSQPTQEAPNNNQRSQPPCKTKTSNSSHNTATRRRAECGFGIRYDETTGGSVYNPGLPSEVVLQEGTVHEKIHNTADPQTRYPIPNERELRRSKGCYSSTTMRGSRLIQFDPQPLSITAPSDLPYQPPGLQWRGHPCVTTSQLLAQRHSQLQRHKDKAKKPT